jgi:hypothetical protein
MSEFKVYVYPRPAESFTDQDLVEDGPLEGLRRNAELTTADPVHLHTRSTLHFHNTPIVHCQK